MYSIKFYLRNAKKGGRPIDKDFSVWMYVTLFGERRMFRSSLKVNAKDWDFRSQTRKGKGGNVALFNKKLRDFKEQVEGIYLESTNSPGKFWKLTEAIFNPEARKQTDFFTVHHEFIETMSKVRDHKTIQTYKTNLKALSEFSTNTGYLLTFDSINLRFYDLWMNYLYEDGKLNDTIDKRFAILKTFMKWAFKRKYHSNMEYQHFDRIGDTHHDIVTLTEQELFHFYEFSFQNKRMERIRDLFCFACFTGQRWSDISQFRREDLKGSVWTFVMEKGGRKKKHSVPLTGFFAPAYDILIKYDFKLPVISNQKFNEALKEAARIAGIDSPVEKRRYSGKDEVDKTGPKWKFMTSHMARRTAATILMNYLAPVTVKELLGHSDIKTTMKYKNEKDSRTEEGLKKVAEMRSYMKVV